MAAKIDLLVEGTARRTPEGNWIATSGAVLIRDEGRTILADPGQDEVALLSALFEVLDSARLIDLIFLSHHHLDHIVNMRLFPWAEVLMGNLLATGPECVSLEDMIPGTNIRLAPTPGHCQEHWSLLFDTEELGPTAFAGDVFWWQDHEEQRTDRESLLAHVDPTAEDVDALHRSRELLLSKARTIIPGHGKLFRVM